MYQQVTRGIFVDGRVVPLVVPLVRIRDVAGRAADPPEVPPSFPSLSSRMASQALLPEIGIDGKRGIFLYLVRGRCGRQRFHFFRKALRFFDAQLFHVFRIDIRTDTFMDVLIAEVAVVMVVAVLGTEAPQGAMDLPRFRRHEVVPL